MVITHPEKVLFPDDGITKGELAAYYESVAPAMLPHLLRRPITMERFHRGIGEPGFYQKSVTKGAPAWLERIVVPKKGGTVHHPLVTDLRSLLWLANQNCITLHVWATRAPHLSRPDICIFDLDPAADEPDRLRAVVLALRALLSELGLASLVKTSGSKGYHVAVGLDARAEADVVARFTYEVGRAMARRDPRNVTLELAKSDRGGRIFLDTGRNQPPATFAAPYTVRARPGAPVSAPCTWEEIEAGIATPRAFTLRAMAARIAAIGDPWSALPAQGLDEAMSRLECE